MATKKDIVLFVNDSYFSYLSAHKIIESNYNNIQAIIFSRATKSSKKRIFKILKKTSFSYFTYRSFVQLLSVVFYRNKSIRHLADRFKIKKIYVNNESELNNSINKAKIGLAFNFDLIIRRNIIDKFENGIFNIHASKLPMDKGISPVLWAFARGDEEIWSTIYQINEGIDSGPIAKQFQIPVLPSDTSFSLYKRVSLESGEVLNSLLGKISNGEIMLKKQSLDVVSNYFSWPDKHFQKMMNESNRRFIKLKDFI